MSQEYWQNEFVTKGASAQREYPHEQLVGAIIKLYGGTTEIERSSKSVLDLGCGNGRHLKLLCDLGFKKELYGLDWSEKACSLSGQLVPQAHIWEASFMQLPFADRSFDFVIDVMNHQHTTLVDYQKAVSEVSRVLKSDGYFYTYRFADKTDPHNPLLQSGDFSLPDKRTVANVFTQCGLAIRDWEIVTRAGIAPAPTTYVSYHSIIAQK